MDALQRFIQLPPKQIMALTVALSAVVALIMGAWMWGQAPDYRVLYANVSDRDGGAIVQALSQMNVPYKFSEGGTVMVPSNQIYETRLKLASQGLPKGSTGGFDIMEQQKLGTTQFQEQVNFQRSLEGELAKSIQSLSSVQGARVHLAIPKPTVFLREQQKPSASVIVNLYPGRSLDRNQVSGVIHLVSSSIPELIPQNVTVVDQNGNLLSTKSDAAGLDPGKLAYAKEVEQSFIRRINDILEPVTGSNNVRAQVTADIDFDQNEQTAETYKPNNTPTAAAIRSQQSNESNNSTGTQAGGVPGAQSNQPTPSTAAGSSNSTNASTQKESTINYEVDKTVRLTRQSAGVVKRLSAAVVVNQAKTIDAKGAAAYKPLDKAKMDQITALVKEALGFNETRGDTLNVVNLPFNEPVVEKVEATPIWQDASYISLAKEFGKNAMIVAFGLYLVFGVLKPLIKSMMKAVPPPPRPQIREEDAIVEVTPAATKRYENNLEVARQIAQQDPKVVANVVKSWVGTNE